MSDERQITSDAGDVPLHGTGKDDGRIERLRELLTAPIKIPDSESGAGHAGEQPDNPEDYPAPTVDIPPHVRAAAEAAAHAGDEHDDESARSEHPRDGARRPKPGRKRRTWADAFLDTGKRELPGSGGDAAAQLLARLDELDRRTGQDLAGVRTRAEDAATTAGTAQRDLQAAGARLDSLEQQVAAATAHTADTRQQADALLEEAGTLREEAGSLHRELAALREHAAVQHDEVERLTTRLAAAETSAATVREQAAGAARKAGTATVVAVTAAVLAVVALGAALAL